MGRKELNQTNKQTLAWRRLVRYCTVNDRRKKRLLTENRVLLQCINNNPSCLVGRASQLVSQLGHIIIFLYTIIFSRLIKCMNFHKVLVVLNRTLTVTCNQKAIKGYQPALSSSVR